MTNTQFHTDADDNRLNISHSDTDETVTLSPITLDGIREASRDLGNPLDRLSIHDIELACTNCNCPLETRFSATFDGHPLCWDCAMEASETENNDIQQTTDPTKVVLGESGLYHKSLCDYVINVATGCTHGCKFCYVPSTPSIAARQDMLADAVGGQDGQQEWGR